jgi:hypothetical protein
MDLSETETESPISRYKAADPYPDQDMTDLDPNPDSPLPVIDSPI